MVEAQLPDKTLLLDADFGVVLEHGVAYYQQQPEALALAYQTQLGRVNDGELMIANELKNVGYQVWNGTSHFITKKILFRKVRVRSKVVISRTHGANSTLVDATPRPTKIVLSALYHHCISKELVVVLFRLNTSAKPSYRHM